MNYGEIKLCDIANGEGVRVSLFVSGCTHHCKNCFNPQTWSFDYGEPFTKEVEDKFSKSLNRHILTACHCSAENPLNLQIKEP